MHSLAKLIKKEEKDLKEKKEEEERKRKREEQETPQCLSLRVTGLLPEQFYLLADVDDNDKEEEEEQQQQQQEVLPTKKTRVGHKTKFPQEILSSIGDNYKQFKQSC